MAVIGGESCFEKNAFEDTENPPAHQNSSSGERISREIFGISKKLFVFVLKLFMRPILFHRKISFDNLTYFKLYGNLDKQGLRSIRYSSLLRVCSIDPIPSIPE